MTPKIKIRKLPELRSLPIEAIQLDKNAKYIVLIKELCSEEEFFQVRESLHEFGIRALVLNGDMEIYEVVD